MTHHVPNMTFSVEQLIQKLWFYKNICCLCFIDPVFTVILLFKTSWESLIVFSLQDRSCVQLWKLVTLVQWRHSHTMVSRDLWYFITWPWQRHSGHALITATSCPKWTSHTFRGRSRIPGARFFTAKLHARGNQQFRYLYGPIQVKKSPVLQWQYLASRLISAAARDYNVCPFIAVYILCSSFYVNSRTKLNVYDPN